MSADPPGADRPDPIQLDATSQPPRIALDREAGFDLIRAEIQARLAAEREVWRDAEVHLDLGQREPDLFHLRRLIHALKDEFGVNVVGLRCESAALRRFAERELKVRIHLSEFQPEPAPPAFPEPPVAAVPLFPEPAPAPEEPTAEAASEETPAPRDVEPVRMVHRTLRSGTVLRHGGDVVLFGDVNPGAEVVAGGSITVLGTLLGLAHAGTRSGERAWILALELRASQLRIGPHIAMPGAAAARTAGQPELASVRDGQIFIEPYRGRLPRAETRRSEA